MRKPYGITIFCDDIRFETNGKHIYVGVYHNSLNVVGKGTIAIPSLHCAVRLMIPSTIKAKELVFRILQDDNGEEKVLVESPAVPLKELPNATGGDEKFVNCLTHLTISPLIIASNFTLKSRAYLDGEEVRLGVLSIEKSAEQPPPASANPTSSA